jgi:hypothetical protein
VTVNSTCPATVHDGAGSLCLELVEDVDTQLSTPIAKHKRVPIAVV